MKTAVALAIAVCGTVAPVRWSEARDQALNYDAPGSCPTRAQFLAALARQTAKEHGGRSNDVTGRIVVEIGRADAGWHGSLRLIDGDNVRVAREVLAQDCREAFDALVLMAAFALDAEQGSKMDWLTQKAPTDSPAAASTPTNTGGTESAAEPLTDAAGDELAAPLSGGRGIGPDSAHDDAPDRSGASVTLTATVDRPPGEASLPRRAIADGGTIAAQNPEAGVQRDWLLPPSVPGWAFGMAASLRSQQSPELSPGGEVVCFYTDRHGWFLRVALAGTRSGEATVEGKRASFAWIGGSLDGCLELPLPGLSACASGEAGQLVGKGENTEATERAGVQWRDWAAVGPAMRFQVPVLGLWAFDLGFAGLYTLSRPRFVYAGETPVLIHEPSPLAFAATAGVHYSLGRGAAEGSGTSEVDIGTHDGRRGAQARFSRR